MRGLGFATLLVGGALGGVACGGDDDNGGSTTSSSGNTTSSSSSTGSSGNTSTSSSSSSSSTSSSSSSGQPTVATAPPVFAPVGGQFQSAQSVTITGPAGAQIFFTVTPGTSGGTNPTQGSTVYSGPISVAESSVIRAFALAPGLLPSEIVGQTYTITIPTGATNPVTFSPGSGEYENPVQVGLATTTSPSTICYTIDNSTPTCNNGQCTGTAAQYSAGSPIPVDAATGGAAGGRLTVKAIACSPNNNNSDVTQSEYTFRADDVDAQPGPGLVAAGTVVTLHTDTGSTPSNNVRIRWNTGLGGAAVTDPTCANFTSQGPNGSQDATVTIAQNTEIRAIACRGNYADSPVTRFTYTVKLGTPTFSATLPAAGTNNTAGSQTGVKFNALTPVATVTADSPTTPAGELCYRVGADPVCTNAGGCDPAAATNPAQDDDTAPQLDDNTESNIRVRQCRAGFEPSDVAQATYTFTVQNVAIRPTGTPGATSTNPTGYCTANNTPAGCFEPTTNTNFYNFGGGAQAFRLTTARANTAGDASTGTSGATIRYATATGTDSLPTPPDLTCTQAPSAAFTTCSTADVVANNCTVTVQPFTTIKAIGCRGNYQTSPQRTLVYADPTTTLSVQGPTPTAAEGPFNNDVTLDFTATPAQPTNRAPGAGETRICYTTSVNNNALAPTCSTTTGTCGAPTGTVGAGDTVGEYAPCSNAVPNATGNACTATAGQTTTGDIRALGFRKPVITQTGTIVKAIACKAGQPSSATTTSQPYTLKVATPTFSPANGTVGFDTAINFATGTNNARIAYRRSDVNLEAAAPSCTGDIAGQQSELAPVAAGQTRGIREFDQTCVDNEGATLGSSCAAQEQFKLIACRDGYLPSDIATSDFTANLSAPTLTPAGNPTRGFFYNTQTVVLDHAFFPNGTPGARVCYSTDGGTPACGTGTSCTGTGGVINTATDETDITVGNQANPDGTTIRAIACATGYPSSGITTGTYNFRVQPYTITPAAGAQPNGGRNISFVNSNPAGVCIGGTNPGTACSVNVAGTCTGGGVCSDEPTTGAVLCYSIDNTEIPANCTEVTTGPVGNRVPRVFCSAGAEGGNANGNAQGGADNFAAAGGDWAPANLQGISTNTTVKSRACKVGFVPTAQRTDAYQFGTYSRAETIDGNNNFSSAENRIATDAGTEGSTDIQTRTADTTQPTAGGSLFVSYTATDIYVGFQGTALTANAGSVMQFYVRGSGGGTGAPTTEADEGEAGTTNPFGADTAGLANNPTETNFHFFINPAGGTTTARVRIWNGTAWINPTVTPSFNVQLGGTLGTPNAYVEWRISRADIGLTGANPRLVLTGSVFDEAAANDGVLFPVNSPAGGFNWRFLNIDLNASLFPSNRSYVQPAP